ncbi:MAG: tetratricopeptide repeat protein [Acidobacteriota bacterium]|nr:tetratricopeptide repeat protein [Acidobacteriota bacterium]
MGRPFVTAAIVLAVAAAAAQTPEDRKRARIHNQLGWDQMTAERVEDAARSFQQAIDIDRNFEDAYYGLGRANIALKKYVAAIEVLSACRDLYQAGAGRQFSSQQDAQRYRFDRITELDEQIRQVQSRPQTLQAQDMLRQLNNQRRDIQNAIQRGSSMAIDATVPPWVSLSLGSAYFRAGRMADAEREYKAAIAADPKFGEAHSNLAVVYLETGRIAEADASLRAATKAGFKMNPQLEQAIKDRMKN